MNRMNSELYIRKQRSNKLNKKKEFIPPFDKYEDNNWESNFNDISNNNFKNR
jgi:hypothetical protein